MYCMWCIASLVACEVYCEYRGVLQVTWCIANLVAWPGVAHCGLRVGMQMIMRMELLAECSRDMRHIS